MIRHEFDLDSKIIYLNSGSHSICPRTVLDAVTGYQRAYEQNPTNELHEAWPRLWKIQKEWAHFLGAEAHEIFLRANVTAAMNEFILGTPLPAGSEILTSDLEYGAILNICSYRAQRDKLTVRTVALPTSREQLEYLTENELTRLIVSQIRPETKMLVLSHVMTGTGLILPIAAIAEQTRQAGIFLVIDGAHATGAISVDFRKLENVDFYGGNLHKWMMGPKGTGFGWVSPRNHDILQPIQGGWTTFETPEYYGNFGDGNRFQGKFLLAGCHDFSPFFAIHETLEFWNKLGPQVIQNRIYELQRFIEKEIDTVLKWRRVSPPEGSLRGPLLTYETPESWNKEGAAKMFQILREHHLQIALVSIQDRLCLRVTPHIYNLESELQRAVQILKGL